MKQEDQIKAMAELDGWKQHAKYSDVMWNQYQEAHILSDTLKQYLTSYDAIIPLIQRQSNEIKADAWYRLGCINWGWLDATPSQLCEAILRSTGKWKSENLSPKLSLTNQTK